MPRKPKSPTKPKVSGIIYALLDPVTHDVCYVGQTKDVCRRKWQHSSLSNNRHRDRMVCQWICDLLANDLKPIFIELEQSADIDSREVYWIAEYKRRGARLLNMNDGGAAPTHFAKSPRSVKKGSKRTPLHNRRAAMAGIARSFLREKRYDLHAKVKARIAEVDAAIDRAIAREGREAAFARINAALSGKNNQRFSDVPRR